MTGANQMHRRFLPFVLFIFLSANALALELKVPVKIGVDLDSGSAVGSDLKPSLMLGSALELYFHRVFGLFVGVDYLKRGYATLTASSAVGYVDIPFGMTLQYGSFGGNGVGTFKIGGFYAMPTSKNLAASTPSAAHSPRKVTPASSSKRDRCFRLPRDLRWALRRG